MNKLAFAIVVFFLFLLQASYASAATLHRGVICTSTDDDNGLDICYVERAGIEALGGEINAGDSVFFDQVIDEAGRVHSPEGFILVISSSTFNIPSTSSVIFTGFDSVSMDYVRFYGGQTFAFSANRAVTLLNSEVGVVSTSYVHLNGSVVQLVNSDLVASRIVNLTSWGEGITLDENTAINSAGKVNIEANSPHAAVTLIGDSFGVHAVNFIVKAPLANVTLPRVIASGYVNVLAGNINAPKRISSLKDVTLISSGVASISAPLIAVDGVFITARDGLTLSNTGRISANGPIAIRGEGYALFNGPLSARFTTGSTRKGIDINFGGGIVDIGPVAFSTGNSVYSPVFPPTDSTAAVYISAGGLKLQQSSSISSATGITLQASDLQLHTSTMLLNNLLNAPADKAALKLISCTSSGLPEAMRRYFSSDSALCDVNRAINVYGYLVGRNGSPFSTASVRVNSIKNVFNNEFVSFPAFPVVFNSIFFGEPGFYRFTILGVPLGFGTYELNVTFSDNVEFTCTAPSHCEDKLVRVVIAPREDISPVYESRPVQLPILPFNARGLNVPFSERPGVPDRGIPAGGFRV